MIYIYIYIYTHVYACEYTASPCAAASRVPSGTSAQVTVPQKGYARRVPRKCYFQVT